MEMAYNKTPFDGWPALKVLLCKQTYDTVPMIPSKHKFTKHFYRFVESCVHREQSLRPTVEELLDSPFIKQAKTNSFVETFLFHGGSNLDTTSQQSDGNSPRRTCMDVLKFPARDTQQAI